MSILDKAKETVGGERQDQYGDVSESFERIAMMWSGYLGQTLNKQDVANLMILMKVSRAKNGYHEDSYIDIAGYVHCVDVLKQRNQQWNEAGITNPEVVEGIAKRWNDLNKTNGEDSLNLPVLS